MYTNRFFAAALLCAALAALAAPGRAQLDEGEPAPAISIKAALNGSPADFKEFRGKVLMLDFFATW